jgi:nucleoside-diphosphate-sugar epimerase
MIATRLAETGVIGEQSITAMTLLDVVPAQRPDGVPCSVVVGDLSGIDLAPHDVVVHLAAIVSAEAEADLGKGLRVDLDGTRHLLDKAVEWGTVPLFLFASSVAVFSAEANEIITDRTEPAPRSSYGAQKLMGEVLVRDFTRRGLIQGRTLRFPTVSIRPGKPNKAASSFASSILREPLAGQPARLPVPDTTRLHLMSPDGALHAMEHALALDQAALGPETTITLPGLSVTVADMLEGLERAAPGAVALVKRAPDAGIAAIVASWPGGITTPRAEGLGFAADPDLDTLIARSRVHL